MGCFTIAPGTRRDYELLARFHYRAGCPATICRVLAALVEGEPRAVGVLVVSRPTPNGPWREAAWPGRYTPRDGLSRRACLRRLNAEVRTISRVIVHPSFRGLGIGSALVRAYLHRPLAPRVEAIAALGPHAPLFAAAGMRRLEHPPSRRVVVLRRRLDQLRLPTWRLTDPDELIAHLRDEPGRATRLAHALRVFAGAHRDTRARAHSDLRTLISLAARRIGPAAHIYIWPPR